MSAEEKTEQTPPPTQEKEAKAVGRASPFFNPAFFLAAAALAVAGWQAWDTRVQTTLLQQELAKRLADEDAVAKESRLLASQAQEAVREIQVKLGLLQEKFAESQNQQVALEALYQELSRNRDESVLADVEQVLLIANQQLQLAGNVKAALIALSNADQRLARLDRPQLTPLRKVLARDIDKLKALPYVDTVGIAVRLDELISEVDSLPLAMEARPPARPASPPAPGNPWLAFAQEVWQDVKQLVRIRDVSAPQPPLLAPDQEFFLRENLKLRLLSARIALLSHDETSYKADLQAVRDWIGRYYNLEAKTTREALTLLKQLAESEISIELPDISDSLEAVRNYRLLREKAPQ